MGMGQALIISIDDHFGYWGAVCLDVAGISVTVMGARAWGVTRLSNRFRPYIPCGLATLRHPEPSILESIRSYCQAHRIDWIVPADLPGALLVAQGRDRIMPAGTFPVAEPGLIETWNDKGTFAALL